MKRISKQVKTKFFISLLLLLTISTVSKAQTTYSIAIDYNPLITDISIAEGNNLVFVLMKQDPSDQYPVPATGLADYDWSVYDVQGGPAVAFYAGNAAPEKTITFNTSGTYNIAVDYGNASGFVGFSGVITVNALTPAPPTPIANEGCLSWQLSYAKDAQGFTLTPPPNVEWNWQGKNANGVSRFHNGSFYNATDGDGTYYLRAYNTVSQLWSANSVSIEVDIASVQKTWYLDEDGDGYGDINSPLVAGCDQPEGYVLNSLDQCPDTASSNQVDCSSITLSENYVSSVVYQKPYDDTDISTYLTKKERLGSVTYFDELGRTKQKVALYQNPLGGDLIHHFEYDATGRETKSYLPYPEDKAHGIYHSNDQEAAIYNFYNKDYSSDISSSSDVYSKHVFENSPLNRLCEQSAPGKSWNLGSITDAIGYTNGHTIKFDYKRNTSSENTSSDNVKLFTVSLTTNDLELSTENYGNYHEGTLFKTITKDENWRGTQTYLKDHTIEEFTDKSGRTVLKRIYNNNIAHDTYYVYDDYGNLSYVLTPKVDISSSGVSALQLKELCYQYRYDFKNRLVEKQLPGKEVEYIVYDDLDRVVLTQDPNLRTANKWLFTKYDALNRVIYKGIYTHGSILNQSGMQSHLDTNRSGLAANYETRVSSGTGIENSYYSNSNFPSTNIEVHSVNYYDDYNDFLTGTTLVKPTTVWESGDVTTRTKGKLTGSKIRVLDVSPTKWVTSVVGYDTKGRPIWEGVENEFLGVKDIVKIELDFVDRVLKTINIHSKIGKEDIVTIDKFTYDNAGRLLSQIERVGDSEQDLLDQFTLDGTVVDSNIVYSATDEIIMLPDFTATDGFEAKISNDYELIVLNEYDEIGQLKSKKVGGEIATTGVEDSQGLQTIDYQYNIRGWLKSINDPTNLGSDLFGFKINYTTKELGATNNVLYNGNISETIWKTANDVSSNKIRGYAYDYDALNRIKGANYGIKTTGVYNLSSGFDMGISGYDRNGNITGLWRDNITDNTKIDDLVYTYDNGGESNRLKKVEDSSSNTDGFKDGVDVTEEYMYDDNGNMTQDKNKGITGIAYNHLNMPTEIQFGGTNKIEYIYDATGMKLQKKVIESGKTHIITRYAGNYVYKGDDLEFFNHSEGYIYKESGSYKYVYHCKDHLANIRLSYEDKDLNGIINSTTEIVEESNFYPFGLKHKGYNTSISSTNIGQRFKTFQGQEINEDLGLNWHSFKWRNYDASLARFHNIDPIAEDYLYQSPYNFSENRIIDGIELEGLERVHYSLTLDGNGQPKLTHLKTDTHFTIGKYKLWKVSQSRKVYYNYSSYTFFDNHYLNKLDRFDEFVKDPQFYIENGLVMSDFELLAKTYIYANSVRGKGTQKLKGNKAKARVKVRVKPKVKAKVNPRHILNSDKIGAKRAKTFPSVVVPESTLNADIKSYNSGNFTKVKGTNNININGNIYGLKNEGATLYPISGKGFVNLTQGQIKAIKLIKNTPANKLQTATEGARISESDLNFAQEFVKNY